MKNSGNQNGEGTEKNGGFDEEELRKLNLVFRILIKKIHPDNFDPEQNPAFLDTDFYLEAQKLTQELNEMRNRTDDESRKNDSSSVKSWQEIIEKMEAFKNGPLQEFLARVEAHRSQAGKKNEAGEEKAFPDFEKFKERYRQYSDFIENGKSYFNEEGEWIRFDSYNKDTGLVTFFDSRNKNNRKRAVNLSEFESLMRKYIHKENPKTAKQEKTDKDNKEKENNQNPGAAGVGPEPEAEQGEKAKTTEQERAERAQEWIETQKSDAEEADAEDDKKAQEKEAAGSGENQEPKTAEMPGEAELLAAVEKARVAFAKKDYEISGALTRLKNIFQGYLKTHPDDIKERSILSGNYKRALKELSEHRISSLRSREDTPGEKESAVEIENLVKFFNQDEKINLYEAHTNARIEIWEKKFGKVSGKAAEYSGKFVNWYRRKVNWKTKIAVGVGATLAGAGFVVIGQRVVGGIGAGVGAATFMEARHRKKESLKAQKERETVKEEFNKDQDQAEKYENLKKFLESQINDYDKNLKTEKEKARNRKLLGAGLAIFLGSGTASHLFSEAADKLDGSVDWVLEKTGLSEILSKKEGWLGDLYREYVAPENAVNPTGSGNAPEASATESASKPAISGEKPEIPPIAENVPGDTGQISPTAETDGVATSAPEQTVSPLEKSPKIELTVKKDSSFQETIMKQLEERGMKPKEAGRLAHRMWDKFADRFSDPATNDYNLIQPGAKIELSLDANGEYQVSGFQDGAPGSDWIGEAKPTVNISDQPTEVASGEIPAETDADLGSNLENLNAQPETPLTNSTPKVGITPEQIALASLAGVAPLATKKEKKIFFPAAQERAERVEIKKMKNEFKKMAKKYKFEENDSFVSRAKKLIRRISLDSLENWSAMKNLPFSGLEEENFPLSKKLTQNIEELKKECAKSLGDAGAPKKGETLKKWLSRVIQESLKTVENEIETKKAA